MDLKHEDLIPNEANICLADFCPVFGCSYIVKKGISFTDSYKKSSHPSSKKAKAFSNVEPCTESDIEKRKNKCEEILNR